MVSGVSVLKFRGVNEVGERVKKERNDRFSRQGSAAAAQSGPQDNFRVGVRPRPLRHDARRTHGTRPCPDLAEWEEAVWKPKEDFIEMINANLKTKM